MTSLGAIDYGDIDHTTDAAMAAAIAVCDTGLGYCKRCHVDRRDGRLGTCRECRQDATRRARCIYCRRSMRRGVLQECYGDQTYQ